MSDEGEKLRIEWWLRLTREGGGWREKQSAITYLTDQRQNTTDRQRYGSMTRLTKKIIV